jgi:hypothetical protein
MYVPIGVCMKTHTLIGIAGILALCGAAASAQDIHWLNAQGGDWENPENWSGGNVPDTLSERAIFGLAGTYGVTVSSSNTFGGFTINNPNMTLRLESSRTQTIHGDILNHGLVLLNQNGNAMDGTIVFANDATIGGSGDLRLFSPKYESRAEVDAGGFTIVHESGHTIRGSGTLHGEWINRGDIIADDPDGTELRISGTVTQQGFGRIIADNGTLVLGYSGLIQGGQVLCAENGTIDCDSDLESLESITNHGTIRVGRYSDSALSLDAGGTILNNGLITLNPQDYAFQEARLYFHADTTILGRGEIEMRSPQSSGLDQVRIDAADGVTLTVGAEQILSGSGHIEGPAGGKLVNNGVIVANRSNIYLQLSGVHAQGSGEYRAEDGGILRIVSGFYSGVRFDTSKGGEVMVHYSAHANDITNNGTMGVSTYHNSDSDLYVSGTLTNNGTLTIRPGNFVGHSLLHFVSDSSLKGSGTMIVRGGVRMEDGVHLTIESGQTVTGTGGIRCATNGSITNNSVITGSIWITGDGSGLFINNGIVKATSMEQPLVLSGVNYERGIGSWVADHGILRFSGSEINGITFETLGSGVVETPNSILADVINLGKMSISTGTTTLTTDLQNEGVCSVSAQLHALGDVNIEGSGTIELLSGSRVFVENGSSLTVGPNQSVRGHGTIAGDGTGKVMNRSVIIADVPDSSLRLIGNHDGEGGEYRADHGRLSLEPDLKLHNATLDSSGDGIVVMGTEGTATLVNTHNKGTLGISGTRARVEIMGEILNDGLILINSDQGRPFASVQLHDSTVVHGTGTIRMGMSTSSYTNARLETEPGAVSVTIGAEQTLTGAGLLGNNLIVRGTINPDGEYRAFMTESIDLADSTQLIIDLGGTTSRSFDRFIVRGQHTMALDGSITINLDPGYSPGIGDVWEIIQGSTTGTFDEIITSDAPEGLVYRLIYESDRVYVILTCQADLSGDGAIDFQDVSAFLNAYNAIDPIADMNGDGVFNFYDVSGFLNAFNAGCP